MSSEQLDELVQVADTIGRLPDPMRRAMTLRMVYNFDHDAIAARMRIPLEEVEQLLADAAIRIKNALELERLNIFQRAMRKAFGDG